MRKGASPHLTRGERVNDDADTAQPLVPKPPVITIDDRTVNEHQNDPELPLWIVILYYTLASGTLLVINKVAVVQLPAPTFVLLAQLLFSAAAVMVGHVFGAVTITKATPRQLLHFLPVVVAFLGTIYANIKVLQHSNVETFITFRSSTPLVLAFCDWFFLGRQLPSRRSWAALAALLLSAAGYAYYDKGFVVDAYVWLLIWYVFFTFEGVWVKHMCDTVPMGNWARVYYANLMSSPCLAIVLLALKQEQALLAATKWTISTAGPVALSCVVGVAMSHASYLLRSGAAATTAAVVGIVCKLLSVAINLMIWDKHATPVQLAFLMTGIFAAAGYKQAPLRQQPKVSDFGEAGGKGAPAGGKGAPAGGKGAPAAAGKVPG